MISINRENIQFNILPTANESGYSQACAVGQLLRTYATKRNCPVVLGLASNPDQIHFLEQLCLEENIRWANIHCLQLSEYVDLPQRHPATSQEYLISYLIDRLHIPGSNLHFVKNITGTPAEVAEYYNRLMEKLVSAARAEKGVYLTCIGIGTVGHIAYGSSAFRAGIPRFYEHVKIGDRNIIAIRDSGIMEADTVVCGVNGLQGAGAVKILFERRAEEKTASLLRLHSDVRLFLDEEAAAGIGR